jgi:nucleoside-diphosphate-sugar epimerase
MRVFVTGATGFVGSAVVKELIAAGHQVLGLTRSDEGAKALIAAGAEPHHGDLEDLDSLRSGVAAADGVIHTGFIHDFTRFKEVCEIDRGVIKALGEALLGTNRPLVITSGIGVLSKPGATITEDDMADGSSPNPRVATEEAVDAVAAKGINVSVVRLPPSVHGEGDRHGFISILTGIAREKGTSIYVGEGTNRWPAVHRLDAAKLYRLALEQQGTPGIRYHAVGDEGVAFKDIAKGIANGLHLQAESKSPEEAKAYFTWFSHFAAMDCAASSLQTRQLLGWQATHPGLLADLESGLYFKG